MDILLYNIFTRVKPLPLNSKESPNVALEIASSIGAWIETNKISVSPTIKLSPPPSETTKQYSSSSLSLSLITIKAPISGELDFVGDIVVAEALIFFKEDNLFSVSMAILLC